MRSRTFVARVLPVVALIGSLGIAACDRLVDPPLPSDAATFTPPLVYSTWWKMTEACSKQPNRPDQYRGDGWGRGATRDAPRPLQAGWPPPQLLPRQVRGYRRLSGELHHRRRTIPAAAGVAFPGSR